MCVNLIACFKELECASLFLHVIVLQTYRPIDCMNSSTLRSLKHGGQRIVGVVGKNIKT